MENKHLECDNVYNYTNTINVLELVPVAFVVGFLVSQLLSQLSYLGHLVLNLHSNKYFHHLCFVGKFVLKTILFLLILVSSDGMRLCPVTGFGTSLFSVVSDKGLAGCF